ncbi:MAG: class E sortase, partial [Actinomycetota bacterium]
MKKYRMRRRRAPVTLLSALAVLVGLGLVLYSVLGGSRAVAVGDVSGGAVVPPRDASMTLTVPEMLRVDNVPVYTAPASDEATLDKGALHVEG